LTQERFLPAGATKQAPQVWQIPMTLKFDDGSGPRERNVLLTQATQVFDVGAKHLDWIAPNGGAWGYYRWKLGSRAMVALADDAAKTLDARERMEYAFDARALLEAGALHGDGYLQMLPRFLRDPEPLVVQAAMEGLDGIRDPLITPELEEPFARYVRAAIGPSVEHFGRTARPGEAETVSLIRPRLLESLADEGQDPGTRAFGDSVTALMLKDPSTVDAGLYMPAIRIAALSGNAALRDQFRARFESATSPAVRRVWLDGLGGFRDPKLVQENLDYALSGPLKPQEIGAIARGVNSYPPNRDITWNWLRKNYDTIMKRVPPMYAAFMPYYAGGCSQPRLAEAETFFGEPAHAAPGAAKELAKVAEGVTDCVELRAREGARVKAFLAGSGTAGVP